MFAACVYSYSLCIFTAISFCINIPEIFLLEKDKIDM